MESIIQGALFGAIGGAIVALIGWGIGKFTKKEQNWTGTITVMCIVMAISVGRVIQSDPHKAAMAEFDKLSTVAALKNHYPEDYLKLRTIVNSTPADASLIDAQNAIRPTISEIIQRQMPKANADSAFDFLQLVRDEGVALRAASPAACVALATGGAPQVDLASAFGPDLMKRDFDVTGRMLVQTATNPQAPPKPLDDKAAGDIVLAGLSRMSEGESSTALALLQASKAPASEAESLALCNFYIAMYESLLVEPKAIAGAKFRSLLVTK